MQSTGIRFLILMFLLPPGLTHSQEMADAVHKALQHPNYLEQAAKRRETDAAYAQACSGYLPSIDFSLGYGRDRNTNQYTRARSDNESSLTLTRREASFTITQMVFDGFLAMSDMERTAAASQGQAYHTLGVLERVILAITTAYLDVLRWQQFTQYAQADLQRHQDLSQYIQTKKITPAEQHKLAQSRLSAARNRLNEYRQVLQNAQATYHRWVCTVPCMLRRPTTAFTELPNSESGAVAMALQNHPQILEANAQILAARAEKRMAKAAFYPTVQLELMGQDTSNVDGQAIKTDRLSAMIKLQYNLFRGGADRARERQAAWRLEAAKWVRHDLRRLVQESTRQAWNDSLNNKARLSDLKLRVETLEDAFTHYEAQFKSGKKTVKEVLDLMQELVQVQVQYYDLQLIQLNTQYRLLTQLGRLHRHFNVARPEVAHYTPRRWLDGF